MHWNEIHITCPDTHAGTISALLDAEGALSVTFKDAGDQPIYEPKPGETPALWHETIVIALFDHNQSITSLIQQLKEKQQQGELKHFEMIPLQDQDWIRANLDTFHPIMIGKRLCICPSWTTPPDPHRVIVTLDPGLAFGTGSHPTTSLCLAWLEEHLNPGATVIDYGCGSGILSLAALKLGAKHVLAIDYDEQALISTRANADKNHLTATQLETALPGLHATTPVDLLIANILFQPLIDLKNKFISLLNPQGTLLLSGILESQVVDIIEIYKEFVGPLTVKTQEGWACIFGKKMH